MGPDGNVVWMLPVIMEMDRCMDRRRNYHLVLCVHARVSMCVWESDDRFQLLKKGQKITTARCCPGFSLKYEKWQKKECTQKIQSAVSCIFIVCRKCLVECVCVVESDSNMCRWLNANSDNDKIQM